MASRVVTRPRRVRKEDPDGEDASDISSQPLPKRPRTTLNETRKAESILPIEIWREIAACIADFIPRRHIRRPFESHEADGSPRVLDDELSGTKLATKGLCSLARTCRSFYTHDVAAEWLYSYVQIPGGETAALFLHTLHDRPCLQNFIHHLTIWNIDPTSCGKGFFSRNWSVCLQNGLELSLFPKHIFGTAFRDTLITPDDVNVLPHLATAILAAILSLLPNLRSLCLGEPVIAHTGAPQLWDILKTLCKHTSRPGGERTMSKMSELTFMANGIETTSFDHTWVSALSQFTNSLTYLHLAVKRDKSNLTENPSITNLKVLRLSYMMFDSQTLVGYINASQTLRELDICLGGIGSSPYWEWVGPLDDVLPQLSHTLERLRIRTGHAAELLDLPNRVPRRVLRNIDCLRNLIFLQIPLAFLFDYAPNPLMMDREFINAILPAGLETLIIQEVWHKQVQDDEYGDYPEHVGQFLRIAGEERNLKKMEFQAQWPWCRTYWMHYDNPPAALRIVSLFTKTPDFLRYTIAANLSLGRYDIALEDAHRVCSAAAQSRKATIYLASVYTLAGRPEHAMNIFKEMSPPPCSNTTKPTKNMLWWVQKATQDLQDGIGGEQVLALLQQASKGLGDEGTWPMKWKLMKFRAYFLAGSPDAALQVIEDMQTADALAFHGWACAWLGDDLAAKNLFYDSLCLIDNSTATAWQWILQKLTLLVPAAGYSELRVAYLRSAIDNILAVIPSTHVDGCKATAMILYIRALHHMDLREYNKALVDAEKSIHLAGTDLLAELASNVVRRARARIA